MRQSAELTDRVLGFTASRLAVLTGLLLALFMFVAPVMAAERSTSKFNHQSTGFPLTGSHAQQECQACHVRGIFKGTPKQCEICHTQGSRLGNTAKPSKHVPTTLGCFQCHSSTVSWQGARFSHADVKPGTCAACHGVTATAKPSNHISTTASCDSCHRTTAWIPATSSAMPSGHRPVPAGNACSTCHIGGASAFTHPSVATGCASCHNGVNARGRLNNAIHNFAGTSTCESCHRNTSSFTGAIFSHTTVTLGSCANCHNGSNPPAVGKPTTGHVVTTAACDSCHRTTAWIPATSGGAMPSGHRPVLAGSACSTCHIGGASAFTHPSVATGCASCHNGVNARGRLNNAIHNFAGTSTCESCHRNTSSFTGAIFSHTTVTLGSCANCHNGSNPPAVGKPTTGHVATTAACDACHRTTAWIPAMFSHTGTGIAGNCSSCHNGTTATGKNAKPNHIQTTAQCDVCHRTTVWVPTSFNHSSVPTAGVCDTCHNGSSATGKIAKPNHVQTTAQCDGCHSITGWAPVARFNHALVIAVNNCSSCHNGSNPPADGKSPAHFLTQRQCDQCHTTNPPWTTVRYTHTSAAYVTHSSAVTCTGCHVGKSETITWKNAAYAQSCAGCHATDYEAGPHKKTEVPTTITYTVSELRNCAGSCHQYTNNTFTTILRTRTGQHRATSGGF
jgi:hypothetical protein